MKKLVFLLCLFCSLCSVTLAEPMRIMVANDLHFLSPELTDNGPAFLRLISQGDGKVMRYISELTDAFIERVKEVNPDVLLLAGDLTFNGETASHRELARRLSGLEIPVYVIPGNHDILYPYAASFSGEKYHFISSPTSAEFAEIWHDFGYADALSRDPSSLSYAAVLQDDLLLLMLDVNGNSVPGSVSEETLSWASAVLKQAAESSMQVLAVSHQTLMPHNLLFAQGFQMGNAEPLAQLYNTGDVLCNLSGHMHIQHFNTTLSFPELVTSALSVYPHHYGLLTLEPEEAIYETESIDMAAYAHSHKLTNPDLLNFDSYSSGFFNLSMSKGTDSSVPDELLDYVQRLNAAYFEGNLSAFSADDSEWKKINSLSSAWQVYFLSIRSDLGKNYNMLCWERKKSK